MASDRPPPRWRRTSHTSLMSKLRLCAGGVVRSRWSMSCRGVVLYALERFDEALASYSRAPAVWPDFAEVSTPTGRPGTCRVSLFQVCC
jgi:hypothetical protein